MPDTPDNNDRPDPLSGDIAPPITFAEEEQDVKLQAEGVQSLPEGGLRIPDDLAILPLRGLVVYPQTAMPLNVGQPRSIRLVDEVVTGERLIGLVAAKDPDQETPGPDDIYTIGTLAAIHRLFRAPDGTIRLLVQGLARIRIANFLSTDPYLKATVIAIPEIADMTDSETALEIKALMRTVVGQFTRMADLVPSIPNELITSALNVDDPLQLVYTVATYIRLSIDDAQRVLELDTVADKLRLLMNLLSKELEVLELGRKIQTEAQTEIEKVQREYFLREQLKAIRRELGEDDEQTLEIEEFQKKIEAAKMPEEAHKEATRELDRLSKLPTAAAEYGVIRTYLDWLTSLPWSRRTVDNLDIKHARRVLNEDHYGLKDIKERIVEFLAVRKLRAERYTPPKAKSTDPATNGNAAGTTVDGKTRRHISARDILPRDNLRREREGAILCFVGPPGVGKTSLGSSIARAMDRRFIRMSLGGVRDEAEIRGFRRTYIGAMPGRVIQTIRRVDSRNPVIMLDEIDKLGRDFRGDPASALLEVLDPEQNNDFRDHYLDVPFDLSEVLFITTANELDPIPGPLLDRMEIIHLSGYTEMEKVQIAKQYLVPRQVRENGLQGGEISFSTEALESLIRDYTFEAGVRSLERVIGSVARKAATRIAETGTERTRVTPASIRKALGTPRSGYREQLADRTDMPGVATGLSVTAVGGEVLFVEATQMPGSKGFQYTGQLGQVMQESARTAFSYVRSKATAFGIAEDYFEKHDIHLHVPAGSVPKDGPSAGVTMATALISLLSGRPIRHNVAMTGEITLRGQVLPVGGIKDKVLAAHRFGIDTVIVPKRNAPDLEDVPEEVRSVLTFVLAQHVDEVWNAALEKAPVLTDQPVAKQETRSKAKLTDESAPKPADS